MKTANLATAKNDLSRYVAYVRRGGRVRILVRGVAVADLVPVQDPADGDAELGDLERSGIVRRGTTARPAELDRPGPKLRGAPSAATVRAERDTGW